MNVADADVGRFSFYVESAEPEARATYKYAPTIRLYRVALKKKKNSISTLQNVVL